MGTLYLIRHGQASFGAADYDKLSPLGERQCVRLGEYFASRGLKFEAVLTGKLKRHAQTWAGIAQGAGLELAPLLWPGLNEYDSEAVIRAIHSGPLASPDTPELVKHHFRLLREGLTQWMAGKSQPQGMPSYTEFAQGVRGALDLVRESYSGNVLLVSSGGPISTAVGLVLGTAAQSTIELNLRIRNSAFTEFTFTPKRHALLAFNNLAHLDGPNYAGWETYA
jgi:broad specificity phosphatase PhoE